MNEVLKINNSYVNTIISSNFPVKELSTQDAIIAGGFPLAIFFKVESTKEDFLPLLTKQLTDKQKSLPYLQYTDIDIWIKEGSSNQLLNNLAGYIPASPIDSENLSIRLLRRSKWANTFSVSSKDGIHVTKNVQVVKVKHKTPEDLISTFDLNICKVAWCDGTLFVSKDVINDIKSCELTFNSGYNFGEENFITKLYRSLRFIKYAKRYSLEPSQDICKYIFETIADSAGENAKYSVLDTPVTLNINNYKQENRNTHNMYHSLISNSTYDWFSRCKNFKEDWSLFLLDHPFLKNAIQSAIERDKSKDSNLNKIESILF